MSIKHLTPRSPKELEAHERSLFSGKLLKEMSFDELSEIIHLVNPAWNAKINMKRRAAKSPFHRGQVVNWSGRDGGEHQGIIMRLNNKSASVREDEGFRWNISYSLLR